METQMEPKRSLCGAEAALRCSACAALRLQVRKLADCAYPQQIKISLKATETDAGNIGRWEGKGGGGNICIERVECVADTMRGSCLD